MATLYGPHIPFKRPGDQLDDRKIANNWLEVERWARRLNEQIQTAPAAATGSPGVLLTGYGYVPANGTLELNAQTIEYVNGGDAHFTFERLIDEEGSDQIWGVSCNTTGHVLISAYFEFLPYPSGAVLIPNGYFGSQIWGTGDEMGGFYGGPYGLRPDPTTPSNHFFGYSTTGLVRTNAGDKFAASAYNKITSSGAVYVEYAITYSLVSPQAGLVVPNPDFSPNPIPA